MKNKKNDITLKMLKEAKNLVLSNGGDFDLARKQLKEAAKQKRRKAA